MASNLRSSFRSEWFFATVQGLRVSVLAIRKQTGTCLASGQSAHAVHMLEKRKVVLIREPAGGEEVAEGTRFSQFILGVGDHRVVFDFTTRVTRLPDQTKPQSGAIVPIPMKKRKRPK